MSILSRSLLATATVVAMTWTITWTIPAHALSMHECSVKYHAAQTAKTLNGMSWKDFRKARMRTGRCRGPGQHIHQGGRHRSGGSVDAEHR
jgi:hypothetical protein